MTIRQIPDGVRDRLERILTARGLLEVHDAGGYRGRDTHLPHDVFATLLWAENPDASPERLAEELRSEFPRAARAEGRNAVDFVRRSRRVWEAGKMRWQRRGWMKIPK